MAGSAAFGTTDRAMLTDALNQRPLLPSLVLALAMFGYPLIGNVVSLLGIDSRTLSLPFRGLVMALSLFLLLRSGSLRLTGGRMLLLLIWLGYGLRLVYDLAITGIEGADYALQFFLAGCVLPAFAQLAADDYRQETFAALAFGVAAAGCAATVAGSMLGHFGESDLTESTGRLSTVALNPVSLGHLAVSAVIIGVVLWRHSGIRARVAIFAGMLAAIYCLVMSGSKGPVLALVVVFTVWAAARGTLIRVGVAGLPLLAFTLLTPVNPLANRLASMSEDLSTLDRIVLLRDSLDQVLGSPIFGSAFIEFSSGMYPHNMLLDAALALGIPLALVFVGLAATGAIGAWRSLRTRDSLLGLLFVQALVAGMLSGALFAATGFWCLLALLLRPGCTSSTDRSRVAR